MFCKHYGKLFSIIIKDVQWKDKWGTPRHEENPFISIALFNTFFFNWEWKVSSELGEDMDYWEQVIWWLYYCTGDISKAKETWPWQNPESGLSTWNDRFLLTNSI